MDFQNIVQGQRDSNSGTVTSFAVQISYPWPSVAGVTASALQWFKGLFGLE